MNPVVKVGAVQYELKVLQSEEEYWDGIRQVVKQAQEGGITLLVFPEYLTGNLLALQSLRSYEEVCAYLDSFTEKYIDFFQKLSKETHVSILAGTHIHQEEGQYVNEAFLFFPDGRIEKQKKIHLTPEERNMWKLAPGNRLNIIDSPLGKMAILICYDIEFPELSRIVAEEKVEIILCPTYTDTAAGYYRVRHCSQARAIENQRFVVLSGLVGELPHVPQIDTGFCYAGAFSPCDHPFPADGVLALGSSKGQEVVVVKLDLDDLHRNWKQGQVSPYFDRKEELYQKLKKELAN